MRSLLQERCELEFEHYVAEVRATKFDSLGMACVDTPYGGQGIMKAGIPHLIRDIHAALAAKLWFSEYGPRAMQPLPLGRECITLLRARGALHLLGLYGISLERSDFDFHTHPQPFDYFCGVMAHPHAPEHVRYDEELLKEFPAKELPGLCNRLVWSGEHLPVTHSLLR
jgi:hypothetical protein